MKSLYKRLLTSIENNISNADYSVEELGLDVAMSRMQLYRKLKALTGQSANEFIRTIRLKRAAQMLEQNQLTIAEITYEVGFNDLQYFRECFKKQFGVTPSEYMQKRIRDAIEDGHTIFVRLNHVRNVILRQLYKAKDSHLSRFSFIRHLLRISHVF